MTNDNQFLKRNNAYTVVITVVYSAGAGSAEEAYYDKATLIGTVTIPTGWTTTGAASPPEIDIQ
ncbi:MAG: hypothetical protein LUE99_15140 [Bacteroides sp.]|nr:hypothetical protein [Bacteroides sp.]